MTKCCAYQKHMGKITESSTQETQELYPRIYFEQLTFIKLVSAENVGFININYTTHMYGYTVWE